MSVIEPTWFTHLIAYHYKMRFHSYPILQTSKLQTLSVVTQSAFGGGRVQMQATLI